MLPEPKQMTSVVLEGVCPVADKGLLLDSMLRTVDRLTEGKPNRQENSWASITEDKGQARIVVERLYELEATKPL